MAIQSDGTHSFLFHDKPMAAPGLISYRYPSPYGGFIMIGARDHSDALHEAARSLTRGAAGFEKLEIWDAATSRYVKTTMP